MKESRALNLQQKLPKLESLVWDKETKEYTTKEVALHSWVRKEYGRWCLFVSAENGDGAADYWGTDREPWPTINPRLEEFAKQHNCYWEWQNPGCIVLRWRPWVR
jgi:hypothetical protein